MGERFVVPSNDVGLGGVGVAGIVAAIFFFGLCIAGWRTGGIGDWGILPISLLGLAVAVGLSNWAFRRRAVAEPGLILDNAGIYDNVSLMHADRIKWEELDRVWLTGPRRFRFLCLAPNRGDAFMDRFDDARSYVMRFHNALFGAPVVIFMPVLEIEPDSLWARIGQMAGEARRQAAPPNFVAGT